MGRTGIMPIGFLQIAQASVDSASIKDSLGVSIERCP
jgi:hypothetical protein